MLQERRARKKKGKREREKEREKNACTHARKRERTRREKATDAVLPDPTTPDVCDRAPHQYPQADSHCGIYTVNTAWFLVSLACKIRSKFP